MIKINGIPLNRVKPMLEKAERLKNRIECSEWQITKMDWDGDNYAATKVLHDQIKKDREEYKAVKRMIVRTVGPNVLL